MSPLSQNVFCLCLHTSQVFNCRIYERDSSELDPSGPETHYQHFQLEIVPEQGAENKQEDVDNVTAVSITFKSFRLASAHKHWTLIF